MDGQISIFDIDYTYDRNGKRFDVQGWMRKERCENCRMWCRLPVEEQPPAGWGVYGTCLFIHDLKLQRESNAGSLLIALKFQHKCSTKM